MKSLAHRLPVRPTTAWALFAATLLAQAQKPIAVATEPTVTLEGRVIDMRGEPVPAAKVWGLSGQDSDTVLAESTCDGDGRFKLPRMIRRTGLVVRATAADRCVGETLLEDDKVPVEVRLHDCATLRGVLRDRTGRPVVGTVVRAVLQRYVFPYFAADCFATTDAEGAFRLTHVPLAPMAFSAIVPGEGMHAASLVVVGDATVSLQRIDVPTTSLDLSVSGVPVGMLPAVRVLLEGFNYVVHLPPPWQRPRLSADGTCKLVDLPNVHYTLRLECPGFAFDPCEVEIEESDAPHRLSFTGRAIGDAPSTCRAVLRDAEDQPLPAVRLQLRALWPPLAVEAVSDPKGQLAFPCHFPPGKKRMLVSILDDRWVLHQAPHADSLAWSDPRYSNQHEYVVDPDATSQLQAVPACEVAGRVLLADGDPAAFAWVQLTVPRKFAFADEPYWLPADTVLTDAAGRFTIRRLHHTADARIEVQGRFGSGVSASFSMADPGARHPVPDLRLARPCTVQGVARDAQGRPAPGIRVSVSSWNKQNAAGSEHESMTDREGRYRMLGVLPGDVCVQLPAGDEEPRPPAATPFPVQAGKTYTHDLQVPAK